jgi:hypothetical protein
MDWIKKNYDQFLLAVLALALLVAAVLLVLKAQSFGERFAGALSVPTKSKDIPALDQGVIQAAKDQANKPALWISKNHDELLFTSAKYTVKNGVLVPWKGSSIWIDYLTGRPVPTEWISKYGLPETDARVLEQDADADGFLNADEWRENTDPTKKESHPAYHTRLFLKQWIKVPFRLKFQTHYGDQAKPEAMDFQVNPLDAGARTKFVKIGEVIEGTKFKVIKFEFKQKLNDSTGEQQDVSELTVENIETGDKVALVLDQVVSSPSQFGRFEYMWGKKPDEPGQIIDVPKTKEFVLRPDVTIKYKLLDVSDTEAHIEGPNGEKITVKLYRPANK